MFSIGRLAGKVGWGLVRKHYGTVMRWIGQGVTLDWAAKKIRQLG